MERGHKPNVLIVDDESAIREIIVMDMEGVDANFLQAENGADALKMIAKFDVALIVSDIMMPGMSGIELLKNLRERGVTTPFIVLTGFGSKDHSLQALRLGAFDFVEKPFKPEVLRPLMVEALKISSAIKMLDDQLTKSLVTSGFAATPKLRQAAASVLALKALRINKTA